MDERAEPRQPINTRGPPPEPARRDPSLNRRGGTGDDKLPLLPDPRQTRPGDVSSSANVPRYPRPNDRAYPVPTRKRSGPSESGGFDYYTGYPPDQERPVPYVSHLMIMFAIATYSRFNLSLPLRLYIFLAFKVFLMNFKDILLFLWKYFRRPTVQQQNEHNLTRVRLN